MIYEILQMRNSLLKQKPPLSCNSDQKLRNFRNLQKKKKLLTAKQYCKYVSAEFPRYAYSNLKDSQLFYAIYSIFKN